MRTPRTVCRPRASGLAATAALAVCFARGVAEELPSPAELDSLRWNPRPCVNLLEHLRRALAEEASPTSEEEALSVENTGEEANRRILQGLGRLPRADDEVDWDAVFNRFTGSEPKTLNPLFNSSRYDFWVEDLLFVSPLALDWEFRLFGNSDVVERWETSEDRLMDRVVYRRDLKWSDGAPLTARDVEFTFRVLTDPKIRSAARRSLVEGLRAVKAYGDYVAVYFHKEPRPTNDLNLAWPIVPRHALEKALEEDPTLESADFNRRPVTCGPYRLAAWRPREELLLERNELWYRGEDGREVRPKPFFRQVRFRAYPETSSRFAAFLAGETDDTQLDSEQWVELAKGERFAARAVKVRCEEGALACIGWNAASKPPNPFFGDRRVRLAMALSLDHEYLRDKVLYGIYQPGKGVFPPGSWMAAEGLEPRRRDAARAAALLEEAGWVDSDGDGIRDKALEDGRRVPFRFTLSIPDAGTGPKVARQLAADLETLGVKCEVQLMDYVAFQRALEERRVQAFIMGWGHSVDPDSSWNLWHSEAIERGRNYTGYANPRVDELFEKGRLEFDPAKRAEIYREIDRRIYEDQPVTVLVYQPALWAFSKSVRGYRPSLKGFFGHSPGFQSLWKVRAQGAATTARRDYTTGLLLGLLAALVFFVVLYAVARAASRPGPRGP